MIMTKRLERIKDRLFNVEFKTRKDVALQG